MANENAIETTALLDPICSTDNVWYKDNMNKSASEVLDEIQASVAAKADANHAHTGYADADHTHTGYADADHTHTGYADADHTHTGYAVTNHTHDGYAGADHTHTGFAPSSHTHEQSDVAGLIAALQAKANATHDHTLAQIVGLVAALAAKADLVDGKVPAAQLPSYVDDVEEYTSLAIFPAAGASSKIYVDTTTNKAYRWSGSAYVEIAGGVALGETSATAYRGDRGKTAYDHSQNEDVHVTSAQKTAWDGKAAGNHTHTPASIGAAAASHTHDYAASGHTHTPAGIGAATANHGHSYNDLSDKPTIPAAYSHPSSHPASMITGLADVATSGSYDDLSDKPTIPTIPASLPANGGNADTVDGKHANDFAAASHNHDSEYIAKALQFTSDAGTVKYSYTTADGKNVLTEIAAYPIGVYTVYSQTGVSGNPKHNEAWRFMIHKTGTAVGWVMAFGSSGSVYSNYVDGNGWKGWKCIFDANPSPLWSGTSYLSSTNGTPQTATPTKKLSECRTGWLLVWSDYDPGSGTNDSDFCTTIIPKYTPTGGTWGGKAFYCDIPMFAGDTPTDLSTERRCIKPIYVHDNHIEGSYQNTSGGRNDVVLRAIWEI